jgi:Zn-dependent peptidase ImmA (M78 family)
MKEQVNPKMIHLAREYRELTQKDLAALLGVTPGVVSKMEGDILAVSDAMLTKLSAALRLPKHFFFEPANIYPLGVHFYRKAKGIPQKTLTAIKAEVNIDSMRIDKLLDATQIAVEDVPLIDFETEPEKYKSIADVARAVRMAWAVPEGPIENMTKLLEDVGIIVVFGEFNTRFFDSVSFATRMKGKYVVFVNSQMSGDRIRYSLAHECGHIILHRIPHDRIEIEANEFAGEFLMPEKAIRPYLSKVTLETLANLKRFWKVSMQAILMRAHHLKMVTDNQYGYLWVQMAKMGYKMHEPIEIAQETPSLLREIVNVYINDYQYSEGELKAMLYLDNDGNEYKKYYPGAIAPLRIVPRVYDLKTEKGKKNRVNRLPGRREA